MLTPVQPVTVEPVGAVGAMMKLSPPTTPPSALTVHVMTSPGSGIPSLAGPVHDLLGISTPALARMDVRIVVTPMASDPASTATPRARRIRLPRLMPAMCALR
jgi:hypothetical protein